ncbi:MULTISPECIES: transcriptional regulator [Actinokineospora]|uniref:Thiaminase-2/PQQC domain-containing protein n=1 Tax=Actinokineospora fastidiosa TaxID=1816 RepID=A0A918GDN0_9PSEU|nr:MULTISPECIES: transcriptional regulator [Actinokineospora]UVS79617.1 hypothetical protein Actkin_03367 [Actinokineospora sp. UTMC 2448]GGS29916.1 hypothetical protein GCM10010171_24120 [Actinokineospora fastidiosa]
MGRRADEVLAAVRRELAESARENRMVALVEAGSAPLSALGALAAEQHRIIASDWRAFLMLAAQAGDQSAREFFTMLGQGEAVAAARLVDFAAACGLTPKDLREHTPQPGCQAYPSYIAWLVMNGSPRDALLAIVANFAEWGGYCAAISRGLRERYGFDETGTAFFDLFATPAPDLDALALRGVQEALDDGWDPDGAMGLARLLQGYESMFWDTLADLAG